MVLPRPPYNPDTPIPNDPFFWPPANYVSGPLGPLIIGSGLNVSADGILTATGGGGGSGVTSIVAGTRMLVSPSSGVGTVTLSVNTTGLVTVVTATPPVVSSGGTTPQISVLPASTTQSGVVQLNNTTSSTATNLALTAAQGKNLQDQVNVLSATSNLVLAGTINASNGQLASVTTAGTAEGFVAGSLLPAAAVANDSYFVLVTTAGTFTPPGGSATSFNIGDWVLLNGSAWQKIPVGSVAPAASTTVAGVVQLATDALTQAGVDGTTAVTPASLQSKVSNSTNTTSSTTIASSTAVKAAYDLAAAALPLAGGTMTGNISFTNNQPVDAGSY